MQHFECPMGCWTWCGNPCLWDPGKSSTLLFHSDGTPKTLKERGLGWDDPAPAVEAVVLSAEQAEVLATLRRVVGGRNPDRPMPRALVDATETGTKEQRKPPDATETATEMQRKVGRPKKGGLSSTERARLRRERLKKPVLSGDDGV